MPKIHFDFLATINLLGIVQGFFLAIVFLSNRKGNKISNRILGFIILIGTLAIFEIFACYTNFISYVPFLVNITEPLDFLFGPLVYLYTVSLIREKFSFKQQWFHFIPAVIFLFLRLPYLMQSNEFKLQDVAEVYHRIEENDIPARVILWFPKYHFGGLWMDLLTLPSMLGYYIYSYYLIFKITRKRKESFWNNGNLPLKWLVRMLSAVGVSFIFVFIMSFSSQDDMGDIYIATYQALFFYGISFMELKNSRIFDIGQLEAEKKKYEKSSLDEKSIPDLIQKISIFMEKEQPFLNSNISLSELSDQLNLTTHHLSQIINEQFGKNFSDFVNDYRIEEFKRKLQDPKTAHIKIEELAFESGFNSKSVFNIAFKKATGTTPSQFRKSEISI